MEKLQVTRDSLENETDLDKFAFEAKISFNENFFPSTYLNILCVVHTIKENLGDMNIVF